MIKPLSYLAFLCCFLLFTTCKDQSRYERNYIFLGHTYDWAIPTDDHVDPRIEALQLDTFDQVWLGGDICARTTEKAATLDYLDTIFDLGNPHTHWTLGNHDVEQGNLEYIFNKTKKTSSYATTVDNFCLLVLNTNIFFHPKYKPTPEQCEAKREQLELLKNIADTIQVSSHLVVLHHYCLLTNEMMGDSSKLNKLFHFYHPELLLSCEERKTFEGLYYPLLKKIQDKGIQVVLVSGDIGMRTKEFEFKDKNGIVFLASGINNSCGKETAIRSEGITSFDPDKVLIFNYKIKEEKLSWEFVELNDLVEVRLPQ